MLLGYVLASKIKNKEYIFKTVIFLGLLLSVIHISKILFSLITTGIFEITYLRYIGGKDNFLLLIACTLLVLNKKDKYFTISFRYKKLTYLILATSFIFYFSRTMVVAFLILLLASKGYTKITKKAIIIGFSIMIGILVFYKALFSFDIERGASGLEGFLYKLKIAPSEIFTTDVNMDDASERWDHWRAYEAKRAFETMRAEKSITPFIIGMGSGSLIDLGFVAPLGNEHMQYIPKIHNGYAYVFFKTGIIGISLYLLFLLNLYLQSYIRSRNDKLKFINNYISGIAIFYLFTSFIISGIFNPKDVVSIFLGALLFLQLHYNKIA
ncbi:O-antigen ligase family protein [Xanthomarina sp. F2636L]|uniref:O-antigen ligase family protein n=1 Tax=Xanthomarina sp. F2636L TaxID=2996018 RepID=UPI00225E3706|nr:O-antigen ligase family protein [Xanthomarina sp. F2636L]MCX7551331.1 O-antigen ligase family protein [Xanthomarina sp. F2636L]